MVLEAHTLGGDFAELREGEDLVAAAVRQDRAVPAHEFVQATEAGDEFFARAHMEVVGVAENDLRAERFEFGGRHGLHRRLRADGHEDRGLDRPAPRLKCGGAGVSVPGFNSEVLRQGSAVLY